MQHSASTLAILDGLSEEEWVLHGSRYSCDYIYPSAPHQDHLIPEYNCLAVYGTCVVEIAILYATIRTPSADWGWQLVDDPHHPHILVLGPENLHLSMGYIHLVKREEFPKFILGGLTCLSYNAVRSRREIAVYPNMLQLLVQHRRIVVMSYEEYERQKK
jgi:hypothetical protein